MIGVRIVYGLGLPLLLAQIPMAGAQTQPPSPPALSQDCQTPGLNITGALPLPNAAQAIRDRKVLKILSIGATTTRGRQQRRGDYVALIEQVLERTIKDVDVKIIDRGVSGELARNAAERIRNEVALDRPDLVLWQVGTSDAFAQVPPAEVRETVASTVEWLKRHKVDVALVGMHYLKSLASDPHYQAIRTVLRDLAEAERVPRIGRYEAMQLIEQAESTARGGETNEFALTENGYACLAEYVVLAITSGVFARNVDQKPKP